MEKLTKLPQRNLKLNVIHCADNLEVMKQIPCESIDLIYIDPPFCTQSVRRSKSRDNNVEIGNFDDRWKDGIYSYILFMSQRLKEMHRLLKPTGSLFAHVDYRVVHYLKVELDNIFGSGKIDKGLNHLVNEIIWCYRGGGSPNNSFGKKHDSILWYSKTKKWTFNANAVRVSYTAKGINRKDASMWGRNKKDKIYRPNPNGKIPEDWWIINPLNSNSSERIGYPTQKPKELLERIIKAASNKGDVIADFFCGSGTFVSVAHKLGRNWIGVDISKKASSVIRKRMNDDHGLKISSTF